MNTAQVINLNQNPIAELKAIREQMKALETAEKAAKDQINNLLDQSGLEEIVIGEDKVKRQITERMSFDTKTFESVHPDLYAEFKKSTAVITLRTM